MNLKYIIRSVLNKVSKNIGPENILKAEAFLRFHKIINIDNPKTLSDKICYLEFRTHDDLIIKCSDKYEVRDYIKAKGYEKILVPLIGDYYTNPDDIDFSSLPNQFVLKATFGCKMNIICSDKNKLDVNAVKKTMNDWMKNGFNREFLEPHYQYIRKRIICENYLEDAENIVDYKIHCFNGKPMFILVCSDRKKDLKLNIYDLNWKPIHEIIGPHLNTKEISRPEKLDEMLEIADHLSEDFPFVRVDLYQIKGKIWFGELTFTPDGCILSYFSKKFDNEMGSLLVIDDHIK